MGELIRPVKCAICQQPMYYIGDPRYVDEICLNIETTDRCPDSFFHKEYDRTKSLYINHSKYYIHTTCWNANLIKLQSSDL